ncbi:MAG: hypothetical protein ACI9GZ_000551 [Bacteroidia bacterium]|jgi:hypothetical protein
MKILNLIILLAVIAVNALANILPINGVGTGDVSAQYDNYFTPAGFTFSIWSVIYLGLLAFAVYQLVSKSFKPETIGYLFVINGLANIGWIMAWHYGYLFATLLVMAVLLITLVFINLRAKESSWQVKLPFQIYLGWICVATVANIAVYLKYLDWSALGIPEVTWGMLLVIIAGTIGLVLIFREGWTAASLAIAWGIWGIYNKQVAMIRADTYQIVCLIVIGTLILSTIVQQINSKRKSTI